jgi:hypothetical protein
MTTPLDNKKIAASNPHVQLQKVERALAFRELIKKVGIGPEAGYRIAPALGPSQHKAKAAHSFVARRTRAY